MARDEEDIEYIGLSSSATAASPHQPSSPQRLIMKQSKVVVEEDEGTGSTPKLVLPKGRFRHPGGPTTTTIRTDLHDLHVYALSPWVVRLLSVRPGLSSLQKEVSPLLVSRQFRGVAAAFGSASLDGSSGAREALDDVQDLSHPEELRRKDENQSRQLQMTATNRMALVMAREDLCRRLLPLLFRPRYWTVARPV